jgi:hypothetical protein
VHFAVRWTGISLTALCDREPYLMTSRCSSQGVVFQKLKTVGSVHDDGHVK